MSVALDCDPRRRRFQDERRLCSSCGASHKGIFDRVLVRSEYWPGGERYEQNGALRLDLYVANGQDIQSALQG